MFGDLDGPIKASRLFVSISWASCYPRDASCFVNHFLTYYFNRSFSDDYAYVDFAVTFVI